MVTESLYNEWIGNLFIMTTKGPMSILGHLLKPPGKKMQKMQLTGGVKLKLKQSSQFKKSKRPTFSRRLLSRVVHRRTTQHRAYRSTMQYMLTLSSAFFILYTAFNDPHYTPRANARDPLLDSALFNILLPFCGAVGIIPAIAEILLFLINFQIPIMITQSLVNISNSWGHRNDHGLNAAQEISSDLIHLGNVAKRIDDPTTHTDGRWPTMHPRPMPRGAPSAENIVVAFRKGAPMMQKLLQVFSLSTVANGPFPTYAELADSTRDYLLKRSLELNDANKRRVMLLAMSTMTRRVVLLLTTPPGRRTMNRGTGRIIGNLFSRVKIETVRNAITVAPALPVVTQCDECGETDEYATVTFSRKCGNCSHDMCDTCYSKLQRTNPYSGNSDKFKKCPGCNDDL